MLPKASATLEMMLTNRVMSQTEECWCSVEIHLANAVFRLLVQKKITEILHSCDSQEYILTALLQRYVCSPAYCHNLVKGKH